MLKTRLKSTTCQRRCVDVDNTPSDPSLNCVFQNMKYSLSDNVMLGMEHIPVTIASGVLYFQKVSGC